MKQHTTRAEVCQDEFQAGMKENSPLQEYLLS